jgi:1,4-dihydroxy-2-naphthoate polyprenyltransferase
MNCIQRWLLQVRGPFLILAVVLTFLGAAAAYYDGTMHWAHTFLLALGVVQAHIAVNLFNELSDYQTGIDAKTTATPFSGGSGMMQAGETHPRTVRTVAYVNLFMAGLVGLYFCLVSSWWILALMITGAVAVRFYTSHLSHWMVGEAVAGLTLGSCVVAGVYLALTGTLNGSVLLLSIPPGILTTQLLFLNEFPDAAVDKEGGRYHWVIHFGHHRSAVLYTGIMLLLYVVILLIPEFTPYPKTVLLGLCTLPMAAAASVGALRYHGSVEKLIPFMGLNVMTVLLTDTLLAAGLIIG